MRSDDIVDFFDSQSLRLAILGIQKQDVSHDLYIISFFVFDFGVGVEMQAIVIGIDKGRNAFDFQIGMYPVCLFERALYFMKHEVVHFIFVLREKADPETAVIVAGSDYKRISSFVHAFIIIHSMNGVQEADETCVLLCEMQSF